MVKNVDIILNLRITRIGAAQQVNIVDDGGERGLDVVGDVRDQLSLHAFAADLVIQRFLKSVAHVVDRGRQGGFPAFEVCQIQMCFLTGIQLPDGIRQTVCFHPFQVELPEEPPVREEQDDGAAEGDKVGLQRSAFCKGPGDPSRPGQIHDQKGCKVNEQAPGIGNVAGKLRKGLRKPAQEADFPELMRLPAADQGEDHGQGAEINDHISDHFFREDPVSFRHQHMHEPLHRQIGKKDEDDACCRKKKGVHLRHLPVEAGQMDLSRDGFRRSAAGHGCKDEEGQKHEERAAQHQDDTDKVDVALSRVFSEALKECVPERESRVDREHCLILGRAVVHLAPADLGQEHLTELFRGLRKIVVRHQGIGAEDHVLSVGAGFLRRQICGVGVVPAPLDLNIIE